MERALLIAIQTYLKDLANLSGLPDWVQMWNNQLDDLEAEDEDGNKLYAINFPAIFLEIVTPVERQSIGNGVQAADFNFNLHILHRQDDAGDGTLDQNLNVFDLKQEVYKAVYMQQPEGFCSIDYITEEQDFKHKNVYHFIQTYSTNYIDMSMNQPVNGAVSVPPTALDTSGVAIDNNPADY